MKLPADPHKPVQIRVSEGNDRVPGKSGWYAYYIHGSILSVIDSCRLLLHGVYRTSMFRGAASGLLAAAPKAPSRTAGHGFSVRLLSVRCMGIRFGLRGAVHEASAGNRRKGFPGGLGAVRMMVVRFGLWGAIYEALLRIAGNGLRLRLSPFPQFVRPRINCACFWEV